MTGNEVGVTGENGDTAQVYSDCVAPLRGQYITMQTNVVGSSYIEAKELDVFVYCGEEVKVTKTTQCKSVELDSCANRDLITQSKQVYYSHNLHQVDK